ncbi:WXG100 family type VII secretion target [Luteimicrobium subarcticum]|uniref:ESAT-6-like protein n=1 Tax=Luteimicrobium subarcticum TaxID=620910 RepID=A0A2M8WSS1_9MICO|nr:WXG100 family type VII secretion target [Luteimicrobium subarcticum]PJI93995.1 WXG100 family type VII secretion target [Luteimicrobium subarcticum]
MSRFEVDSAQVALASSKVSGTVTSIRSEVAAMRHHLTELQTVWQGAAATSCAALVDDWHAVQARVEESLDGIQRALGVAAQTYEDAETRAAGLFATR